MKVNIRYQAIFQYEEEASFSPHVVRLFPRHEMSVQTDRAAFATDSRADVPYRKDLFDNLVATCFYPEKLDRLEFQLSLDLTLTPRNPFHFLLESRALELPFRYLPQEAEVLDAYLQRGPDMLSLPEALLPSIQARPTVESLVAMNSWLHENIAYERREEGDPFTPAETLKRGSGSCRDFTILMAEVLRAHGIAARLASGFLWEDEVPESERRAGNALHAWVEAYLPGGGWIGLDPTNGVLCDHHALATAVGLTPADIAPVQGHYYGKKTIASSLETTLTIEEVQ